MIILVGGAGFYLVILQEGLYDVRMSHEGGMV
jgi:hypothetical protein